jgi:hypothetical protein
MTYRFRAAYWMDTPVNSNDINAIWWSDAGEGEAYNFFMATTSLSVPDKPCYALRSVAKAELKRLMT